MLGAVNAKSFGAVGDGVADDTSALQLAIDYCFGPKDAPHGIDYIRNKSLFIPAGKYKTTRTLLITKLQGGIISGDGRFTTTIENVTGGANQGAVIRANGVAYSSISDMQLSCHAGGICLDLDYDGISGGAALQANTIDNVFCVGNYEPGTVGVRIGQSGFMGSEFVFKMLHCQGCKLAGTLINNFNALQHQFYGGQDQGCGIGIWATVGSAPVINGRGFQEQDDCDIKTSGGAGNAMSVVGCRSESRNFILNDGGHALDVSACVQTCPTVPGYFVRSTSGFTHVRACYSNGKVRPDYWCNLTLEGSACAIEIDPTYLWYLPSNNLAANIFIRNCFVYENGVYTGHVFDQRRFTTDGLTITVVDALYGPPK